MSEDGACTDKKGLAARWSISESKVEKMMKSEGLPYFRLGRKVLFRLSEVDEWLELHRAGPRKNEIRELVDEVVDRIINTKKRKEK